jgi:hypothetical protein
MTEKYGLVHAHTQSAGANPPIDPAKVFDTLVKAGVSSLYPDFQAWFYGKVIPGLQLGERCIIPCTIDSRLAGVAICKRTLIERKLCTLWVSQDFRTRGVAVDLARDAFAWMSDSKPLFTVPEERSSEFSGFVEAFSFSEAVPYHSLYRAGRVEYVFNGPLRTNSN